MFQELAKKTAMKPGNRFRPEQPTLIAKAGDRPGCGELRLGGIPTMHNRDLPRRSISKACAQA